MGTVMSLFGLGALLASFVAAPPTQEGDALARFGLKPNSTFIAQNGRATLAEGETIELVAMTDLADPLGVVWGPDHQRVTRQAEDFFWKTLGLGQDGRTQTDVRAEYGDDEDKRTFAMAFRLSPNLTRAWDVTADVGKTFSPLLSAVRRPLPEDSDKSIGEARILKPILPKDSTDTTFDFRLEVPGGPWVTIVEFPFGPETKLRDGEIDVVMRYTDFADFKTVDGIERIVDYKGYYFTMTLPAALRDLELEVVTNDPASDAKLLPLVITQHFRGEDRGEEFKGKDLFLVYGLRSGSPTRKFTLRARPKRIVEFKAIPFKP
jgi:hypothetical protein